MKSQIIFSCITCLCLSLLLPGLAQNGVVPNASFETGTGNVPTGWSPSAGSQIKWENTGHSGNHSISISATKPNESDYWKCDNLALKPGGLYRFPFGAKTNTAATVSLSAG
jgi:hypothetical protein